MMQGNFVLSDQQQKLLHKAADKDHRRVYLTGPPGTGKTVFLAFAAVRWMKDGHDVYILSTHKGSRAVSFMLEQQINSFYEKDKLAGKFAKFLSSKQPKVHLRHYNLFGEGGHRAMRSALAFLTERAYENGGSLHVVMDDGASPMRPKQQLYAKNFQSFCTLLTATVRNLCMWAASTSKINLPKSCFQKVMPLTIPLRCPPSVRREVEKSKEIGKSTLKYKDEKSGMSDGPAPVAIWHRDQKGHENTGPRNCKKCGREIADYLTKELRVGGKQGPCYRDVLVLCHDPLEGLPVVRGLRDGGLPVCVVTEHEDDSVVRQMALGMRDEVTFTSWEMAAGLERQVVIGMGDVETGDSSRPRYIRPFGMSRSTCNLVWIDPPEDAEFCAAKTSRSDRKEQTSRSRSHSPAGETCECGKTRSGKERIQAGREGPQAGREEPQAGREGTQASKEKSQTGRVQIVEPETRPSSPSHKKHKRKSLSSRRKTPWISKSDGHLSTMLKPPKQQDSPPSFLSSLFTKSTKTPTGQGKPITSRSFDDSWLSTSSSKKKQGVPKQLAFTSSSSPFDSKGKLIKPKGNARQTRSADIPPSWASKGVASKGRHPGLRRQYSISSSQQDFMSPGFVSILFCLTLMALCYVFIFAEQFYVQNMMEDE